MIESTAMRHSNGEAAGASDPGGPMRLYATPPHARRLRVLCVTPSHVPHWLEEWRALTVDDPEIEVVLMPLPGPDAPPPAPVPIDLRVLLRYERRRRRTPDRTFEPTRWGFGPESGTTPDCAIACLHARSLVPDLVLLLGPSDWAAPLAQCAALGCWQLDETLVCPYRAAQAVAGPMARGEVSTETALLLAPMEASDAVRRLVASRGATQTMSLDQQREAVFLKVPALLRRALRQLARTERDDSERRAFRLSLDAAPAHAGGAARVLVRSLAARARRRWRRLRHPHDDPWFVLARQDVQGMQPDTPKVPALEVLVADPSIGPQVWADPCVIEDHGRRLLFVEEGTPDAPKAHIACIEWPDDGPLRHLGIVLDRPWHLSFPQVFRWEGQWYMTVESGQSRRVTLYRELAFPLQWEPVADLVVDRTCVDPVLYHHGDHWYLFANVSESGGSTWDELFLFVADDLNGPYRPHPANPIVADVHHARMAGRLFVHDGRLVRPAQECAPAYGTAVVFNEVLELSPTVYHERRLGRLGHEWGEGLDGCHTYSATATLEVLDARGVPPRNAIRRQVG